jgi:hypothetical protein
MGSRRFLKFRAALCQMLYAAQGKLLSDAASLIDAGILRTTATSDLGIINAENLKKAHAAIESGRAHGKLVLAGF